MSVRGEKNQMEESMRVEEGSSSLVEKYMRYELAEEMERLNKTSIYRVPAHIKNMKYSSAYRPQLVSLGPFHHGDKDLWPMEGHKLRALLHLVKRANKPMEVFVDAVKEAVYRYQLEAAYGQDQDQKWRGDDGKKRFVDMMVTDGCFLLEAMRMIEKKGEVQGYAPNDPVFSKHGYLYLKNAILADMFVMENQLPMLLLRTLARLVPSDRFLDVRGMITNMVVAFFGLPSDNTYLLDALLHPYVRSLHPIDIARKILCGERRRYADELREIIECGEIERGEIERYAELRERILRGESERYAELRERIRDESERYAELREIIVCDDAEFLYDESGHYAKLRERILYDQSERYAELREIILGGESQYYAVELREINLCGESEGYTNERGDRKHTMPSALELYEAGIHFKVSRCRSLLDIEFQRGVLSMPVLRVHDYVRTVFLNLLAFEQLHPGAGNGVTEYLIFMDHIIDSAKDVALLRSKGVLDCALGCDKEVAELFNTLSKGAMDPSIKLRGVRLHVNAYCRKPWPKWRASFRQTYLRNPWVFISLVAAAVLLVATLLQTIFTIKPLR